MIDMNADGRVDLVIADEVPNFWAVYLNNPDPHDVNQFWDRRLIDIRPLLQYLPASGAIIQNPDGVFLPLSSTVTGHDQQFNHCWRRGGGGRLCLLAGVLRMWRGRLISTTRRSRNGSYAISMATAIPVSSSIRPLSASWMHPNRLRQVLMKMGLLQRP